MASLYEIGIEYEKSAKLLRQRLKELRGMLAEAEDAETRWKLKRRIRELTPILTECNRTAEHCKRYYERGYFVSDGTFGVERKSRLSSVESAKLQGVSVHYRKRTYADATRNVGRMSIQQENLFGICRNKRSKQIDSISDLLQSVE